MTYSVIFSPEAEADLLDIYNYISVRLGSPVAADNLLDSVEEKVMRLADFPLSSTLVNDPLLANKGYRKLIVENYIIFILVDENDKLVRVARIIYGARNYAEEL